MGNAKLKGSLAECSCQIECDMVLMRVMSGVWYMQRLYMSDLYLSL